MLCYIIQVVSAVLLALFIELPVIGQEQAPAPKAYTLTYLPLLPGGAYDAAAFAINNHGQIVGFSATDQFGSSNLRHAVLWTNGVPKDLGTLGGGYSLAFGINDRGQIVGESATANGETHPFLYDDGTMRDLGLPVSDGHARGINNEGVVVGYSLFNAGPSKPWVWHDGATSWLPALPFAGANALAFAINDRADVVGVSNTAVSTHAVLWRDGLAFDLGTLGGANSFGIGVNNRTQVVGWAEPPLGQPAHAFLWQHHAMQDLSPSGTSGVGMAISDRGQVVGQLVLSGGCSDPFLWDAGEMIDLNTRLVGSAAIHGYARAINNRGQILGDAFQSEIACGEVQIERPIVLNPVHHGEPSGPQATSTETNDPD